MVTRGSEDVGQFGDISIRTACEDDIPAIVEIAEHWQIDSTADSKSGFLVSAFTVDEYRDFLTRAMHFLVAKSNGKVVGFIIAYSYEEIGPEELLNLRIVQEIGPLIVIKQVAVSPKYARSGIARRLYERVLKASGDLPVIAAVVANPPNIASTRFHYAMGFEPYKRLGGSDGRERTVWLCRGKSRELLLYQYGNAVDLYKHEDSLNWSKLNNLLFISGALFTAYGFLVAMRVSNPHLTSLQLLSLVVCIVGITIAAAFQMSLIAGIKYLDARKIAVARLEELLVKRGGARVVSIHVDGSSSSWLRLSPTRYLLRVIPATLILAWATAFSVALLLPKV